MKLPHPAAPSDPWPARLAVGPAVEIRASSILFRQGQPVDTVFLIGSGLVKLSRDEANGQELIVAFRGADALLGSASALTRMPHDATAETVSPTVVSSLTLREFRNVLSDIAVVQWLARTLAREALQAARLATALATLGLRERLGSILGGLALTGLPATDGAIVLPPLTHQELGAAIGASRERVTKELCRFEAEGHLVRRHGRLEIPSSSQLHPAACRGSRMWM